MSEEFNSWLIVSPSYAITVTYASPVSIQQVKHDYPQVEAYPSINNASKLIKGFNYE